MKLYYKEKILKKLESTSRCFYEDAAVDYSNSLGFDRIDFYDCWSFLQNVKDDCYCGEGYDTRAKYYLYDGDTFYWFVDARDAAEYSNYMNGKDSVNADGMSTYQFVNASNFSRYRGHQIDGFYWLLAEDFFNMDEILETPKQIWCESKGIPFTNIDNAAQWLVDSGVASNFQIAKRQLEKHLSGKSGMCYKMIFKEY